MNEPLRRVRPEALTAAAFAPFGDVIGIREALRPRTINHGYTESYEDIARLDVSADGGQANLRLFRTRPLPEPLTIRLMERHLLGSQLFWPLGDTPWLVVVAAPGDLDPRAIRVFLAGGGQGVNIHRGVWHHHSLALGVPAGFLVLDRAGPGSDTQEIELAPADRVRVDH